MHEIVELKIVHTSPTGQNHNELFTFNAQFIPIPKYDRYQGD